MVVVLCYRYDIRVWLGYMHTESNWSDGISRLGRADPWHRKHDLRSAAATFPPQLLTLPFLPIILVGRFL